MFTRKMIFIMTIAVLASMSTATWGLVYWPEDYPATYLQDRPEEQCLARVKGFRSMTVIDPNFILGCAHVYIPVGKTVRIGTNDSEDYVVVDRRVGPKIEGYYKPDIAVYRIEKIKNPPLPEGYSDSVATDPCDLLEDANLSKWLDLYSDADELGEQIVAGGYGKQREVINFNPWETKELEGPGTLHWGRNVVGGINSNGNWSITFNLIGTGDYVKYEVCGEEGDSGTGWFIKDGIEWKVMGVTSFSESGATTSRNLTWIDERIVDMGGVRLLPDLADIFWVGSDQGSWAVANNWDTSSVPTSSDKVGIDNETTAVISSGLADANELFIGIDDGGDLSQSGGDLAIERYMYIGGRVDCGSSSYTISGGIVSAKGIVLGVRAVGLLDVNDPDVEITVRNLQLEQYSELEAEPNSTIQLILENDYGTYEKTDGKLDISAGADANELSGLGNLTFVCGFVDSNEYDPNIVVQLEVAGTENWFIGPNDFNTSNFLLDGLVVGLEPNDVNDASGRISVELADIRCNQSSDGLVTCEALYVNTLELKAGATFELDPNTGNPPFNLYYENGGDAKLFFMGDVDLDGIVDYNDLSIWTAHANDTGAEWSDGDMNGDRVVDINDKTIIETAIEKAKAPWPPNGSTVLTVEALPLSWNASVDADSHDVYFGDNFSDVNDANEYSTEFQSNQAGTTFWPDDLEDLRGDTCYWRIDEVDSNNVVISKGYVWKFVFDPPQLVQNLETGDYYNGIQDAIDKASTGDVIEVYPGDYSGNLDFVGKAITLTGSDPNDWDDVNDTVITSAIVHFQSGEEANSVLLGCTVGGPINCDGSSPTITKCIIMGEIYCTNSSSATIENNKISNSFGNGVSISGSAGVIRNNFIYNCSYNGITFINATAVVPVTNNTIVDNSSAGVKVVAGANIPDITNCIFWDNGDDLLNCTATYSCIEDGDGGTGNISSDPCFIDAATDDYRLLPYSLCINAGDPNGSYTGQVDIDSDQRVVRTIVDMGAHEAGRVYNSDKKLWYYYIQTAINDSDTGDTLVATQDTYSEVVDFNGMAVTLRSTYPNDWDVVADTVITTSTAVFFTHGEDADSVLLGCTVDGGINCDGSSPTIQKCIITDGISTSSSSSPLIKNNKITCSSNNGVVIFNSEGVIKNNWIYGCSSNGILLVNTTAAVDVSNNTIAGNSSAGIRMVSGTDPNISNCILWGNNGDLVGCTATYSCIEDGDGGTGNISSDPCFVDDVNDVYHLDVNSFCINAGDPNGSYTGQIDIDGEQRVYADIVDMGGDEDAGNLVYNVQQDKFYRTIQPAIDDVDANDTDTLIVYPGDYTGHIDFDGKSITLRGSKPDDWDVVADTVITSTVVFFTSGEEADSVLLGCTVDGGINCDGSGPTIQKCIITDGISTSSSSSPLIKNNKITSSGGSGVVIFNSAGVIRNNWIYNCGNGGNGILLINTTAAVDVNNNTVVGNSSAGIRMVSGTDPNISNCILWGNNGDLVGCTATYSCIEDGDGGTGNISSDPCFVDDVNDNFHLDVNSLCINAGDPNKTGDGETDIDGDQRVIRGRVDMGGDEARRVYNIDQKLWYLDIQPAINGAVNGDKIVVLEDTYTGDDNRDLDFGGKAITVHGSDTDDWDVVEATVIDCNSGWSPAHRGFYFHSDEDADSVVSGLTITRGYGDLRYGYLPGRAIFCDGSSPTITNCLITDNSANYGLRSDGGGIACYNGASPEISNCIISDNYAKYAGGITCWNSEPTIRNCLIAGNSAFLGGGIACYKGEGSLHPEIINCTFSDNSASYGGGMHNEDSEPNVVNCIFWDDGAVSGNDEIYNYSADPNFSYCDIEGCGGSDSWDPSFGTDCGGNIDSDPFFVPDDYYYHIDVNSPCIDAGDRNFNIGQVDIDFEDRVDGNDVDMGSDEYDS